MSLPHKTRRIKVWIDADLGIANFVIRLNTIRGVTTHASCQGTLSENGPHPYRAQVMCSWTPEAFKVLRKKFDITLPQGSNGAWGYVHPLEKLKREASEGRRGKDERETKRMGC